MGISDIFEAIFAKKEKEINKRKLNEQTKNDIIELKAKWQSILGDVMQIASLKKNNSRKYHKLYAEIQLIYQDAKEILRKEKDQKIDLLSNSERTYLAKLMSNCTKYEEIAKAA